MSGEVSKGKESEPPTKENKQGDLTILRQLAYAAPSVLTLTALGCSLTSMRVAWARQFHISAGLIMAAAVCDALDGHVARLLDAVTVFGGELDSLGDLVNFGVAPALVIYAWADEGRGDWEDLGLWASCVIFCQACAIRLARFNSSPGGPAHPLRKISEEIVEDGSPNWRFVSKSKFFCGVPAPMGALMALLPLFWQLETGSVLFGSARQVAVPTLLVTAGLMVSTLKTLSSKMFVRNPRTASHLRISSPWEGLLKAAIFGAVVASMAYYSPWRLIIAMEVVYIIGLFLGPVVYTNFAR